MSKFIGFIAVALALTVGAMSVSHFDRRAGVGFHLQTPVLTIGEVMPHQRHRFLRRHGRLARRNLKFYASLKRALNRVLVGKTRPPIQAPPAYPPAWIGGSLPQQSWLSLLWLALPEQLRQPRGVDRDPPRLVERESLGLPSFGFAVAAAHVGQRLPLVSRTT